MFQTSDHLSRYFARDVFIAVWLGILLSSCFCTERSFYLYTNRVFHMKVFLSLKELYFLSLLYSSYTSRTNLCMFPEEEKESPSCTFAPTPVTCCLWQGVNMKYHNQHAVPEASVPYPTEEETPHRGLHFSHSASFWT